MSETPKQLLAISDPQPGQKVWGVNQRGDFVSMTIDYFVEGNAWGIGKNHEWHEITANDCYATKRDYYLQQYFDAAADLEDALRDADEYRDEMQQLLAALLQADDENE